MGIVELSGKSDEMLRGQGVPCDGLASHPGVVAILLASNVSCCRNFRRCAALDSCAGLIFLPLFDEDPVKNVSWPKAQLLKAKVLLEG